MAHFFFDFLTIFHQYKNIDSNIFEFEKNVPILRNLKNWAEFDTIKIIIINNNNLNLQFFFGIVKKGSSFSQGKKQPTWV
jgi:hypothetical protein